MARRRKTKRRFLAAVRRAGRSARRALSRHRSKPTPIGVKVGAAIMVLPPVIFPSIAAGQAFFSNTVQNEDIMTKLGYGAASFIDSVTQGLGVGLAFNTFGGYQTVRNVPQGAFVKTTAAGATLAIGSAIQSWLARKFAGVKQVRILNRRIA